jgi:hypothetical protein
LLTELGALQRLADGDQCPARGHQSGKVAGGLGIDPGDRRRPLGRLRQPIGCAEDVRLEPVESHRQGIDERAIDPALGEEDVGNGEHDGRVRARPKCVPGRVDVGCDVVADRAEEHESGAALASCPQVTRDRVAAGSAGVDGAVLERHAAERHDEVRVLDNVGPGDAVARDLVLRPDDVRQDHLGGARAVAVDRADVATEQVQEPVDLALRVMEPPRARPAVRAAVDVLGAERVDARQLDRGEAPRSLPIDLDVLVRASRRIGARAALQPAAADGRRRNTTRVCEGAREVAQDGRRIRIGRTRLDRDARCIGDGREAAPMRGVRRHVQTASATRSKLAPRMPTIASSG